MTPVKISSQPIEDWMRNLPQSQPILSPRSPLRVSAYERSDTSNSTISTSESSEPSPSDSISQPTDWESDLERELPASSRVDGAIPDDLIDVSSNFQKKVLAGCTDELLPLGLDHAVQRDMSSIALQPRTSLRSLFFPGSMQSREFPKIPVTPLHIASDCGGEISAAASLDSFTTANDGRDSVTASDAVQVDNNDTGIDEDYTKHEKLGELEDIPEYAGQQYLCAKLHVQEIITETQDIDQQTNSGQDSDAESLNDVLAQVALSSPYATSNSDLSCQLVSQEESQKPILLEQDGSLKDKDSFDSTDCAPNRRIVENRQAHPAKHYKMINGSIVQYEPWRTSDQSDLGSTRSDHRFQHTGNFLRSGDKWIYTGAQLQITV